MYRCIFDSYFSIGFKAARNEMGTHIGAQHVSRRRIAVMQCFDVAFEYNFAAAFAAAWPQFNNMIGLPNDIRIMFDDDERIPHGLQGLHNMDKFHAVDGMEPGSRFVQHIERIRQTAPQTA